MKIIIFPWGTNPYQSMLYDGIEKIDSNIKYYRLVLSPLVYATLPIIFIIKRITGYRIIHIHWLAFATSKTFFLSKELSFLYSIVCLTLLKVTGYKIIWTVHNVLPHEKQTTNDTFIFTYLSKISNEKIVHSNHTIKQMVDLGYNTSNITIIPHGNYIGWYENTIHQNVAKKSLGIDKSEFTILLFGLVRRYKGVDELLNVIAKIDNPKIKLVIAGKCDDDALTNDIQKAAKRYNIIFHNKYIDDNHLQIYFNASDVVCVPLKAVTTSGSALLALSFGKPIIAPVLGAIADLPPNVGYLYDPKIKDALYQNLKLALNYPSKLIPLGENAKIYAETLSWDSIAEKTYKIYRAIQK